MDAIRKELGENEGSVAEEYRKKIAAAGMPEAVQQQAERELARFERMGDSNAEASMIRTYLDWLLAVPWSKRSEERLDPQHAREVLDADHAGLDDVKQRITEYLAVRKLRAERGLTDDRRSGAILTLIGPPGTGKTSIGESIARATGRQFVRMSLGGVRDEAEIRGHRRTYIGALPGRLVRALRDAGTMNPVILLDEVDKLGADWRGDPSAALLEVLDPAQNHAFQDHYLDVALDLSHVLFIATANVADTIPGPLLDRMEVIRFDGYTTDEKVAIGRGYLWPRQVERNGLGPDDVTTDDDVLRLVVSDYTREAGVRQLERELGTVLRKTATRIAAGHQPRPVVVDAAAVLEALGRPKFYHEAAARTAVPGVATGLAVTGVGGDVLFVEAASMAGKGGLVLTGQLGDVMKESARIALTYVQSHAAQLGIDERTFDGREFHVHVPAGAIPKDGPSAGVTMVDGAGVAADRPAGQEHGRHDRRGDAAGARAADRRPEAEGAGRARRRLDGGHPPRAQRARPGRRAVGRARAHAVPPGEVGGRSARARAGAERRSRWSPDGFAQVRSVRLQADRDHGPANLKPDTTYESTAARRQVSRVWISIRGRERQVNRTAVGDRQQPGALVLVERALELDVTFDDSELRVRCLAVRTILNMDPGMAKAHRDLLAAAIAFVSRTCQRSSRCMSPARRAAGRTASGRCRHLRRRLVRRWSDGVRPP